jgi:DNA polymerase III delta subunit
MKAGQSPTQILKEIEESTALPRLLLIMATDHLRRDLTLQRLEKSAMPRAGSTRFRGKELSIDALKPDLFALSLFAAEHPSILIRGANEIATATARSLSELLTTEHNHIPVVFESSILPETSPLLKLVKAEGLVIVHDDLTGASLTKWIAEECRAHGIASVDDDVLGSLATVGGGNLDSIAHAIALCGLSLNDGEALTSEACSKLVRTTTPANEFALIDALGRNDFYAAESLLHHLMDRDVSPFSLLGLMHKTYGTYLALRALSDSGQSEQAIAAALGIQPWLASKQLRVARTIPLSKLLRIERAMLTADSKLKNKSLGHSAVIIELFRTMSS